MWAAPWQPHTGQRIGEASNPGPEPDKEMQLASALLAVLQSFKEQVDQRSVHTAMQDQRKDPASKTFEATERATGPQEVSLASRLLSVLQEALKQGWSDSKVAERVGQKVQTWISSRTSPGEKAPRNPAAGSVPSSRPRQVTLKPETKEDKTQTPKQHRSEVKPLLLLLSALPNGIKPLKSHPSSRALEQGDQLPGNIMVTQDPRQWYELRDLFAAHGVHEEFTFACPASPQSLAPAIAVWWRSPKQSQRPNRIKLDIHQMSASPGPEPRPPNQVPIKRTSENEICTLRVSAPATFRACVPTQGSKDSPQVVVEEWARLLDVRTTPLTGGHWQSTQDQTGAVLVGYLRVPKELAEKAVRLSGCRALFATIVAKGAGHEPIRWIDRDRNVSDENYYRFCLSQAEAQGKPLIFRTGGGKNLGILGAGDALHSPRLRTWIVHGAPKAWDQEDLLSFPKANSWNQPAIITRRKSWSKGSPPEWLFRAFAPTGASLTARLKVFLVFPFRLSLNYPFGHLRSGGSRPPKKRRPKPGVPRCLFFIEKTASRGHLQNSRSENLAAKLALRAKAKRKKESENQRERGRVPVHACLM